MAPFGRQSKVFSHLQVALTCFLIYLGRSSSCACSVLRKFSPPSSLETDSQLLSLIFSIRSSEKWTWRALCLSFFSRSIPFDKSKYFAIVVWFFFQGKNVIFFLERKSFHLTNMSITDSMQEILIGRLRSINFFPCTAVLNTSKKGPKNL